MMVVVFEGDLLTKWVVVEITPPGISSLHWRFYIIWVVFNFAFIPIGKGFCFIRLVWLVADSSSSVPFLPRDCGPHAGGYRSLLHG